MKSLSQESSQIYGELLPALSEILSNLFKKTHKLQLVIFFYYYFYKIIWRIQFSKFLFLIFLFVHFYNLSHNLWNNDNTLLSLCYIRILFMKTFEVQGKQNYEVTWKMEKGSGTKQQICLLKLILKIKKEHYIYIIKYGFYIT